MKYQLSIHDPKNQRTIDLTAIIKIGSLMSNQIVLQGEGIEPIHALLEMQDNDSWLLTDLGSDLGVFVNKKRVQVEVILKPGDEIRIGTHVLRFQQGQEEVVKTKLPAPPVYSSSYEESIKEADFLPTPAAEQTHNHPFSPDTERRNQEMLFTPRTASSSGDVLEVISYWGNRILDVEHFHPSFSGFNRVTIGDFGRSHFLSTVNPPGTSFVLADVTESGYTLHLGAGMTARLRKGGRVDQVGEGNFSLSKKDISHVRCGAIRYFFLYTRPPVLKLESARIKDPFLAILTAVTMGLYILSSVVFLTSKPPAKEDMENQIWSVVKPVEPVKVEIPPKNDVVEVKKVSETPVAPLPKPVEPVKEEEISKPKPAPKPVEKSVPKATERLKPPAPAAPAPNVSKKTLPPVGERFGNNKPGGAIKGKADTSIKGTAEAKAPSSSGVNLSKLGLGVGRIASRTGPGAISTQFANSAGGAGAGSGSAEQTYGLGGLEAKKSLGIAGASAAASQFGHGNDGLIGKDRVGASFGAGRQGTEVSVGAGDPLVSGALNADEILGTIQVHQNEIRNCYEKLLQRSPGAKGKVKMSWVINGEGRVTTARVESSTIGDSQMHTCLSNAVKRWQFPKPHGGDNVTVNYPFTLTPL